MPPIPINELLRAFRLGVSAAVFRKVREVPDEAHHRDHSLDKRACPPTTPGANPGGEVVQA